MIVSLMIILIFAGYVVHYFRNYMRAVRLCWRLNGPHALPLFGNTTQLVKKNFLTECVANAHNLYGRCARCWISIVPGFVLCDPHDVQTVLSSHRHTDKMFVYRFLHSFLGAGLLTNNGRKWSEHRRLIQPAFHQRILAEFVTVFDEATATCMRNLHAKTGVDIDITREANEFVLQVLNESILGMSLIEHIVDFKDSPFRKGKPTLSHRLSRPWLILDWIYSLTSTASAENAHTQSMRTFTMQTIDAHQYLRQTTQTTSNRFCLLNFLIDLTEQHNEFTYANVIEETITFMLAGQDAVGAALANSIFLLAQNVECQLNARQEIELIDAERAKQNRNTLEHLREMRYVKQCINESLRLYPSVPLIARQLSEPIFVGPHKLPKGSNILIFPYAIHRMPEHYPDPERFDPNRFDVEQTAARHPFAFIPFSAGPRKCIGDRFSMLELQSILAEMLRQFDIQPVAGRTSIKPVFRVTLRASGGLWVRLRVRT